MKLEWYLHRLKAMDPAEILQRVQERMLHWSQDSWIQRILAQKQTWEVAAWPKLRSRQEAPEALCLGIAKDAEAFAAGRWALFGWKQVEVGNPPTWNLEGFTGELLKLGKETNHRSLPNGADTRVVWEINRWAELVRLVMDGHVNGQMASVERAQAWLEDWLVAHPMGQGLPWRSALEVAIRLTNFAWFDALVEANRSWLSHEILQKQSQLRHQVILPHAAWVQRYTSFGSSANNHRLGELVGLFVAAQRWPELKARLKVSPDALWREIRDCLTAQFHEDGGNREQALHYQLFAMEMYYQAKAFGAPVDPKVHRLMGLAQQFFVEGTHASESWEYGDNDDAQLVPLSACREKAIGEWMAWIQDESAGASIAYWLGNAENPALLKPGWKAYLHSGMAFYQSAQVQLRLDASPLGYGKMAAHGHLDALHLSIWSGEDAIVVDPGTGGYFGVPDLRKRLASWELHNGPLPTEGYRTPRRFGAFLWGGAHAQPDLQAVENGVAASLEHEGHQFTRRVSVGDDGNSFEVQDEGRDSTSLVEHWIFAPGIQVRRLEEAEGLRFEVRSATRRWELHLQSPSDRATVELSEIEISPRFGQLVPTLQLRIQSQQWLKLGWTLLPS